MASPALPVPLRSADDITPDVLTALLRPHDPDVTVTDVVVRRTWQGTTSHLHLDVEYADPDTELPRRLFVKTQLNTVHDLPEDFDAELSEGGTGAALYDDETRFYRDLRADLDVETMTTYFAEHVDGPAQFLILGEDITLRGAYVARRRTVRGTAMTQFTDAPIFDADQHMYETPDALLKYLPEQYKKAVQFVQVGRHTRIAILNKITDYMPNPTFERVAAPGAHEKFYSGQNPEGLTMREMSGRGIDTPPGARNPEDRIAELDRQGVDSCLNYPTLANLVEHSSAEDPELTAAIIHALNQWMREHWGFSHANRVYSTPVINLGIVEEGRRELEYILNNGAKVALIKPAPVYGFKGWRSPALPEFDAFWRDVEDAGLPIVLHASQPPLQEYIDKWEPPTTESAFEMSAFKWTALGHREIADMITSLICHGTLTRFPKLRIASVENGSAWIKPLFDDLEMTYKKMPQNFPEHPHEVFRRNCWVSPFWEGKVADVVETVGWDKVMFGSDWPHPEGLAEPKGYWKYAEGMDVRRTYDFMGDNARRFMGLPIANPDPNAVKPPALANA